MGLLDLPQDILECIVEKTLPTDRVTLLVVCRSLYNSQASIITLLNLRANIKSTVFCLNPPHNRESGRVGYRPFVLIDVTVQGLQSFQDLRLHIYNPTFMWGNDQIDGVTVRIEQSDVYLAYEAGEPGWLDNRDAYADKMDVLDWDTECRGKLGRMTGPILRSRYHCPECSDMRTVCPGCGGFSNRWPELFTSCGWDMPCPCCVGYNTAAASKEEERSD